MASRHSCKLCPAEYKTTSELKRHHLRNHEEMIVKKFECNICQSKFAEKCQLSRHEKAHQASNKVACCLCRKEFTDRFYLKTHYQTDHPLFVANVLGRKVIFDCKICDKNCGSESTLRRHHITCHEEMKRFECNICQSKFVEKCLLSRHEKTHKLSYKIACCLCKKEFTDRFYLKTHYQTDHPSFEANVLGRKEHFDCKICNKNCISESTLGRHHITCHYEQICTKKSLQSAQHIIKQEKESLFECLFCPASFSNKYQYKKHIQIHNLSKPVNCSICQESFTDRYLLTIHLMTKHEKFAKNVLEITVGGNCFRCTLCSNTFRNQKALMEHYSQIHENEASTERTKINPENHLVNNETFNENTVTRVKRATIACNICTERFPKLTLLSKHFKSSHMTNDLMDKQSVNKARGVSETKRAIIDNSVVSKNSACEENSGHCSIPCYVCQDRFQNDEDLKIHISKVHPGQSSVNEKKLLCREKNVNRNDFEPHLESQQLDVGQLQHGRLRLGQRQISEYQLKSQLCGIGQQKHAAFEQQPCHYQLKQEMNHQALQQQIVSHQLQHQGLQERPKVEKSALKFSSAFHDDEVTQILVPESHSRIKFVPAQARMNQKSESQCSKVLTDEVRWKVKYGDTKWTMPVASAGKSDKKTHTNPGLPELILSSVSSVEKASLVMPTLPYAARQNLQDDRNFKFAASNVRKFATLREALSCFVKCEQDDDEIVILENPTQKLSSVHNRW